MTDCKLVPVEPTLDMLSDGLEAYGLEGCAEADILGIFKAMLAAAPAVQGEPVGEIGSINNCPVAYWDKSLPVGTKLYAAPPPAEQQPAPDVAGLVEALEQVIKSAPSGGPLWHGSEQIVEARAALAAYSKGGDV